MCSAPSPQAAEAGACLAPSQEFSCAELPATVKAAVPLQRLRGSSALPLQPNSFYHKSQCTATFQEELSNKYNVNLSHVFVTICNFWKIFPFTKIKRTVYSKNSQALHFLYLRAEKTPPAAKRLRALFHFSSVRRRTVSTAACTSFDMDISDTPTTRLLQRLIGMSTRRASLA